MRYRGSLEKRTSALVKSLIILFLAMLGYLCIQRMPALRSNGPGAAISLAFCLLLIAAVMISALARDNLLMLSRGLEARETVKPNASAIELIIPFTTFKSTQSALDEVAQLANGLEMRIRVIAVQFVPFACSLECPPVSVDFLKRSLQALSSDHPIAREFYLTHQPELTWRSVLAAGSLVIFSNSGRWLPFAVRKLIRTLKRQGHHVCIVR